MSNHDNARRNERKRTEHGPRYEGPETDRNSARTRSKWKKVKNRSFRRTGKVCPKYHPMKHGVILRDLIPVADIEENSDEEC